MSVSQKYWILRIYPNIPKPIRYKFHIGAYKVSVLRVFHLEAFPYLLYNSSKVAIHPDLAEVFNSFETKYLFQGSMTLKQQLAPSSCWSSKSHKQICGLTAVRKGRQVVWPAVGLNIISQASFPDLLERITNGDNVLTWHW